MQGPAFREHRDIRFKCHMQVFDIEPESCLRVSAKTGMGLDQVLPAIVENVPHPVGNEGGKLRMLLFDAVHDEYR